MLAEWQTGITKLPVTAAAMTSLSEDVKEMQVVLHTQGWYPERSSSAQLLGPKIYPHIFIWYNI